MHSFALVEKVVSQRQDVELLHRWANTKTMSKLLAIFQQLREDVLAVGASSLSLSGSHAVELTGRQAEDDMGGGGEGVSATPIPERDQRHSRVDSDQRGEEDDSRNGLHFRLRVGGCG